MSVKVGKRILCDVMDLHVFDIATGKHIMTEEDLTTASLDFDVTTKEVRGGKGNPVICILSSGRKVTIKSENPVMNLQNIATQLGTSIVTGENIGYTEKNKLKVDIDGLGVATVVLPKLPLTPANLKFSYKGEDLVVTTDYTIGADKRTVTILKAGVQLKEVIVVESYDYKTSASARTISIDSESYPKGVKLVCDTYLKDTETNIKESLKLIFPKAIPTGKFSMATKSEVDASQTSIEYTVIKSDDADELGYILLEDYTTTPDPILAPVSDLAVTSTVAGKADLVFSASSDATTIGVKYKLTSSSTWLDVAVATTGTSVRMTPAIAPTDTTAQVINLATGTYDFKLNVVGGLHVGDSNIATGIVVA
jgi:hypothetical protein